MDRRTDRQNYDPQDRSSIAASHGENVFEKNVDIFLKVVGLKILLGCFIIILN